LPPARPPASNANAIMRKDRHAPVFSVCLSRKTKKKRRRESRRRGFLLCAQRAVCSLALVRNDPDVAPFVHACVLRSAPSAPHCEDRLAISEGRLSVFPGDESMKREVSMIELMGAFSCRRNAACGGSESVGMKVERVERTSSGVLDIRCMRLFVYWGWFSLVAIFFLLCVVTVCLCLFWKTWWK
jgi:hypothetical protein